MTNASPRVLVHILNYSTERFLGSCVRMVQMQTYPNLDLVITDNASPGGGSAFVRETLPHVRLRCNRVNLGFARAHNEVIAEGGFDSYLPLNPDVELQPDFVARMVTALQGDPRIGGVNGKLMFMTEEGQKTEFVYSAGHEFNRARRPSNRGYKQLDSARWSQRALLFGVNGAAPLYSRRFLESVKTESGYFDSDFFMYGEDFDLGWRGLLMGFQFLYEPRAIAFHRGFGSGGMGTSRVQREYERNRFITIYKNERFSSLLPDVPFVLAHEVMTLAFYAATQPRRVWEYVCAVRAFARAIPAKRAERAAIMARATVPTSEIVKYFRAPWFTTLIRRQFGFRVAAAGPGRTDGGVPPADRTPSHH